MSTPAHAHRGTASDGLMFQVDAGNVLAVRNLFLAQQRSLDNAVADAEQDLRMEKPGGDPVSDDYARPFQERLDAIRMVYVNQVAELGEVTERLTEAAAAYGMSEQEIDDSFRRAHPTLAPPAHR